VTEVERGRKCMWAEDAEGTLLRRLSARANRPEVTLTEVTSNQVRVSHKRARPRECAERLLADVRYDPAPFRGWPLSGGPHLDLPRVASSAISRPGRWHTPCRPLDRGRGDRG